MICKRCQAEVPEGQRFCPTCGALQPMICSGCGAESRPGSRTCSACGRKLPVADREDRLVYPKRKRSTASAAAAVAAVLGALLLLGGAGWFLYSTVADMGQDRETVQQTPEEPEQLQAQDEPDEPESQPLETEEVPVQEVTSVEEAPPAEEQAPVEEEPPAEEEEAKSGDQWYFADSAERLLTDADIEGFTAQDLKYARNEIYARHGRRFNSQELQAYFDSCDWYVGAIAPGDFDEGVLNDIELANIAFLKAAE